MLSKENATTWARPLLLLSAISFGMFFILRLVDMALPAEAVEFLAGFYPSDIGTLTNPYGGLGEVVAAVLGIEITVVAIIVQLAANKYSSKIVELFVENPVNIGVIALFVVTGINTVLVANTISDDFVPYFSITVNLALIVFSLLVLLPHFNYVFNFLRPNVFLGFVKQRSLSVIEKLADGEEEYTDKKYHEVNNGLNFFGDVALNSVYQGDRAVTILCIGIMRDLTTYYLEKKKRLPEGWYDQRGLERTDPDFSGFAKFVMERLAERRALLENKVFKLYELLFDNSRSTLRDVASGVLLNSRLIALKAIDMNDQGVIHAAYQYFNTYMRIAIRGKDPRSIFTALDHYRVVAERLLTADPDGAERVSKFIKYYSDEAIKNQVLFIPETAAYDLCRLNEVAYEKKAPNVEALLDVFLNLDAPVEATESKSMKEMALVGVRVAQSRLAGFYLLKNERVLARRIFDDMDDEPIGRIMKIRDIIYNTKEEEFWEITPRGINFYYLPENIKEALHEFFDWFDEREVKKPKRGPGRPPKKKAEGEEAKPNRGPGRPPKKKSEETPPADAEAKSQAPKSAEEPRSLDDAKRDETDKPDANGDEGRSEEGNETTS
ncbi:MAG: DUF2254 domain-containing protein [Ignavibacteriales bacterium]|nr:DUF2254 domain-containing protein [Ignavibacteriales bacterium]